MRHQLRPSIDGLENKALLSHLAASMTAPGHALQAEVRRDPTTSAMTVSLTTNQKAYNPGQVVKMTLTLTNTSKQNETVFLGPSIDPFFITQNGKVIWRSTEGAVPQYIVKRILKPGQSASLSAQWTVPASLSGSFAVHNQWFPNAPSPTFTVTTMPISPTQPSQP